MIRRLNFTDRKRIKREHISISLGRSSSGAIEFDAAMDLSTYELPASAQVFVEAYRRTTVMRFPLGTVGEVAAPDFRELTDFDRPEGILFRVKISESEPDRGKLLAEADQITFREPEEIAEQRVPLLPVQAAELGPLVCKLDFTDHPVLLINESLGDWREVARSEPFVSLVLPDALRDILTRIYLIEKAGDVDDESETWQSKWIQYTRRLPGIEPPPDDEADQLVIENWIDDVVKIFCARTKMRDRFRSYWEREEPK